MISSPVLIASRMVCTVAWSVPGPCSPPQQQQHEEPTSYKTCCAYTTPGLTGLCQRQSLCTALLKYQRSGTIQEQLHAAAIQILRTELTPYTPTAHTELAGSLAAQLCLPSLTPTSLPLLHPNLTASCYRCSHPLCLRLNASPFPPGPSHTICRSIRADVTLSGFTSNLQPPSCPHLYNPNLTYRNLCKCVPAPPQNIHLCLLHCTRPPMLAAARSATPPSPLRFPPTWCRPT